MKKQKPIIIFFVIISIISLCSQFTSCNNTYDNTKDDNNGDLIGGIVQESEDELNIVYSSDIPILVEAVNYTVPANEIDNTELISIAEKLYKNGIRVFEWSCGMGNLSIDSTSILKTENDGKIIYSPVTKMANMDAFKANCTVIFSYDLLKRVVFPQMTEGEYPLLIEENGKLYINQNTGGAVAIIPDYDRAEVINKSTESFEIKIPMISLDDQEGEVFIYKAIIQNEKWVLDSHYYFQR